MLKVGVISRRVIELLGLEVEAETPIYIGESNVAHMLSAHPNDYNEYNDRIPDIIKTPDYVGINPKDQSIEYIKVFWVEKKNVKVAVRVSAKKTFFARSVYSRDNSKVERFIEKGYLIKY